MVVLFSTIGVRRMIYRYILLEALYMEDMPALTAIPQHQSRQVAYVRTCKYENSDEFRRC